MDMTEIERVITNLCERIEELEGLLTHQGMINEDTAVTRIVMKD